MKTVGAISALLIFGFSATYGPALQATPSVNDMQGCQALLEFVDYKMDTAPKKYAKADVKTVKTGLAVYNDYIQSDIVTPGLLAYTGGDSAKAGELQSQVDNYKKTVIAQYKRRYPQDRVFMDHAVSINNCAKQAVPSGAELEALKSSLETLVRLAQMN